MKLGGTNVEYVPIDSIRPNSYNPNRQADHEFELLCRSMEEDGFTQPILVQRETREIVDGEHRWRAAQALGHAEIPVVLVDMTPEQMRISTLRHNRARGNEDIQLAAEVMKELQGLGAINWAADSLMLDDRELELFKELQPPEITRPQKTEITFSMVEKLREQENEIRELSKKRDIEVARKESDIFTLHLVYAAEEGQIIEQVLGKNKAQRILELCKKKLGSCQEQN